MTCAQDKSFRFPLANGTVLTIHIFMEHLHHRKNIFLLNMQMYVGEKERLRSVCRESERGKGEKEEVRKEIRKKESG